MRRLGVVVAMGLVVGCGNLLGLDDEEPGEHSADAGDAKPGDAGADGGFSASSSSGSGASSSSSSGSSGSSGTSSGAASSSSGADGGSGGAPAEPRFTKIAAGGTETCGVLTDGTAACTGTPPGWPSSSELLGIVKTQVAGPPLDGVHAIAVGDAFACAGTDTPRRVWCWGSNAKGALGDGTSSSSNLARAVVDDASSRTPVSDWAVSGLAPVAAAGSHACALRTGGRVMCWGDNTSGQLGNGASGGSRTYAAPVVGLAGTGVLENITQLAVGLASSCALHTDRRVYCWGATSSGALGDGVDGAARGVPAPVLVGPGAPLTDVTHLTFGGHHGCAVTGAGHLYCWGTNGDQELGASVAASTSPYAKQVQRPGASGPLDHIVQASAGSRHTCAVADNGDLWCWGSNATWQLGIGSAATGAVAEPSRVQVSTSPPKKLTLVVSAATAQRHSAALDESGRLLTWGDRGLGRDEAGTTVAVPVTQLRP